MYTNKSIKQVIRMEYFSMIILLQIAALAYLTIIHVNVMHTWDAWNSDIGLLVAFPAVVCILFAWSMIIMYLIQGDELLKYIQLKGWENDGDWSAKDAHWSNKFPSLPHSDQ